MKNEMYNVDPGLINPMGSWLFNWGGSHFKGDLSLLEGFST